MRFVRAIIFLYRGFTSFPSTFLCPFFYVYIFSTLHPFVHINLSGVDSPSFLFSIMYLFYSSSLLRFFFLFPTRRYDCVYERGRKNVEIYRKAFPLYRRNSIKLVLLLFCHLCFSFRLSLCSPSRRYTRCFTWFLINLKLNKERKKKRKSVCVIILNNNKLYKKGIFYIKKYIYYYTLVLYIWVSLKLSWFAKRALHL